MGPPQGYWVPGPTQPSHHQYKYMSGEELLQAFQAELAWKTKGKRPPGSHKEHIRRKKLKAEGTRKLARLIKQTVEGVEGDTTSGSSSEEPVISTNMSRVARRMRRELARLEAERLAEASMSAFQFPPPPVPPQAYQSPPWRQAPPPPQPQPPSQQPPTSSVPEEQQEYYEEAPVEGTKEEDSYSKKYGAKKETKYTEQEWRAWKDKERAKKDAARQRKRDYWDAKDKEKEEAMRAEFDKEKKQLCETYKQWLTEWEGQGPQAQGEAEEDPTRRAIREQMVKDIKAALIKQGNIVGEETPQA
jgi:hypothetical protein